MLLAFIFSSYIISLFTNKAKTSITLETQEISLGIIAVISTIIILFVLAHYLNDYAPSNFSISDISYLFPSPLNNNLILLYSMIRSAISGVSNFFISGLFMISMILATTDLSLIGLLPIALAFSLFFVFYFIILSAFCNKS